MIIATFGDMLRIPGTHSSLEKEKTKFGNVRIVYSPLDSLAIAKANTDKKVVFLAVGFETTAPTIALSILTSRKEKLKNLVEWWRSKAINRYETLKSEGRLRTELEVWTSGKDIQIIR